MKKFNKFPLWLESMLFGLAIVAGVAWVESFIVAAIKKLLEVLQDTLICPLKSF